MSQLMNKTVLVKTTFVGKTEVPVLVHPMLINVV